MHTVSQASTNTFLYSNVCGDGGEQKSKKRERMCVCVCVCVHVCVNAKYRKKRTGTSLWISNMRNQVNHKYKLFLEEDAEKLWFTKKKVNKHR